MPVSEHSTLLNFKVDTYAGRLNGSHQQTPTQTKEWKRREGREKEGVFPVYLCKECNRVWQKPYSTSKRYGIVFYKDFPRYGLKYKQCPDCKTQMNLRKRCSNCNQLAGDKDGEWMCESINKPIAKIKFCPEAKNNL